MEHPKFVTAQAIAEICKWPLAFRRRVARHIGLTDSDGKPCDYKEELSFWQDLLVYLEGGPAAYEMTKLQEKPSDSGKAIYDRCFSNMLDADMGIVAAAFGQAIDEGTVRRTVMEACDLGCGEAAAFFLWSYGLAKNGSKANALIDGDKRLWTHFGNWRAPVPEPVNAVVAEGEEAATLPGEAVEPGTEDTELDEVQRSTSGASAAALVPVAAFRQTLFDRLCAEVDEATATPSPGPALRAARTTIDALLEDIEQQARADAVRSGFAAALTALRQRPAPLDPGASARRALALDRLALDRLDLDLPVLSAADVDALNGAARDIHDRIRQADEARRDFEHAAEQHGAARFNRDILNAYEEAIARYDEAETALTQAVEKLATAVSNAQGSPATGASDGEAGCSTP